MVVFVVLYLVVYQLHFSTSMEEKIAQVRYGEVESAAALQSVARYVLVLLTEDAKQDMSRSAQSAGAGLPGGGAATSQQGSGIARVDGGSEGNFTPIVLQGSGGGSKSYDYLHENIFNSNTQQIGKVSVKVLIVDGERAFDLNRLFEYVRIDSEEEDLPEGTEDLREEDVADLAGKSDQEATALLQDRFKKSSSKQKTKAKTTAKTDESSIKRVESDGAEGGSETAGSGVEMAGADDLSEYEATEFIPPSAERLAATRLLVERAILMMFSYNEQLGYRYNVKYSASAVANNIVDYVLTRRNAQFQNRIYLLTELLNVPEVTREVFYGPMPEIHGDEELAVGNGFVLKRDEYGDVAPVFQDLMDDPYLEDEKRQMEELQSQFGRYMDFPGMGFNSLQANALTRGMTEKPTEIDAYGYETVMETPLPIGLKDIFTTFSTGKININTAPVPVLYALLLTLDDGEAEKVAFDIRDYRNRMQEEVSEEGVAEVDEKGSPSLGQPKRVSRKDEESKTGDTTDKASKTGAAEPTSEYDPYGMAATYENPETNYFTNLDQLELIDGTDGSSTDTMRRDEGVERVSNEADTVFRRTIHDLEKVAVFGSTYFTAELKAKPEKGRAGRTGYLTVRRDVKKRLVEVMMWKMQQK